MNRSAVITGIGIVSPNGSGTEIPWMNFKDAKNAIHAINKFDTKGFPAPFAGEVNLLSTDYISPRLAKKMDNFSIYALVACRFALENSMIDLECVDKERFGVYVGNNFGGWSFTEPQLRLLHTKGTREISPYLASAWFPAAPQGQITIYYKLKGHSKTIDCGRASGLASVGYGARAISSGQCDMMLAGGSEALVTPFIFTACGIEGNIKVDHKLAQDGCYRPFDRGRDGWVPGEGAAFLVLEEAEHAYRRNAHIYCEVAGFCNVNNPCHTCGAGNNSEKALMRAMSGALKQSKLSPEAIDLIMADGLGTKQGDLAESEAIKKIFDDSVLVTTPKSMCGHLYGAAGALDIALSALSIERQRALPTINLHELDPQCGLNVVANESRAVSLNHILINGRSGDGVSSSLIVSKVTNE